MRRILLIEVLLVIGILLPVCLPSSAIAQEQDYVYDSITVDISVLPNGDMDITEVQNLNYMSGTFHYAYRWIPLDRVESITDVRVGEQTSITQQYFPANPAARGWIEERREEGSAPGGEQYAFTTWRENNNLVIGWWFPATQNKIRPFIVKYKVHGGLRIGNSADQLYWKAIFSNRDVPVLSAAVMVHFPQPLPRDHVQLASSGAAAQSGFTDDSTVWYAAINIARKDELEIHITFPHGIINATHPAWQAGVEQREAYNANVKPWVNFGLLALAVLVIPLIGFFWLRRKLSGAGRKRTALPVPAIQYSPPSSLAPALVGALIRQSGTNPLPATIFDLAKKNIIAIQEVKRQHRFRISTDLIITRVASNWQYNFEWLILDAITSPSGEEPLSELKDGLASVLKDFNKEVEVEAVRQGLYEEEPSKSTKRLILPGLLLMVIAVIAGIAATAFLFPFAEFIFAPFFVLFIQGIVAIVLSSRLVRYTERGALEAAQWKAFRAYLKKVARDRSEAAKHMDAWDIYLPYAVLFGLTQQWIKQYSSLDAHVPVWFYAYPAYTAGGQPTAPSLSMASTGVSLSSVSDAFNSMVSTISSTFSGGGVSGGGGGGGGGGGSG